MDNQKKTVFLIGWDVIYSVNYKMSDHELLKTLKRLKKEYNNSDVSYFFDTVQKKKARD